MFNIGFSRGSFHDPERANWSDDGPRPIAWSVWYPTEQLASGRTDAGEGLFVADRVFADATPAASTPLPTVVFSHGTGGSAAGMSWLPMRLAAAGYIAIGVDHHGNTANEVYRPEGFLCWWERARDLTVLLDHQRRAGWFAELIDPHRIFAAGFSLGGYTTMACLGAVTELDRFIRWAEGKHFGRGPREFPDLIDKFDRLMRNSSAFRASIDRQSADYRDPRLKAGLLCAPAPTIRGFTMESLVSIKTPVLIAVGGSDREAPAGPCAEWLHAMLAESRLERLGDDIGHYVFLNACTDIGCRNEPEICVDAPGVDRSAIHDHVAALTIDFFSCASIG